MFDLGPHSGFIMASYSVTVVVLAGLILQSVARYKSAKRRLNAVQIIESEDGKNG
jgi:heme exporter protein CcmD